MFVFILSFLYTMPAPQKGSRRTWKSNHKRTDIVASRCTFSETKGMVLFRHPIRFALLIDRLLNPVQRRPLSGIWIVHSLITSNDPSVYLQISGRHQSSFVNYCLYDQSKSFSLVIKEMLIPSWPPFPNCPTPTTWAIIKTQCSSRILITIYKWPSYP